MKKRNLIVSLDKSLSEPGPLNGAASQKSILGPISFLLYVNDMKSAVNDCDLILYEDDAWILFSNENVSAFEKHVGLLADFNSLCEWFIDNKLSIHFEKDKTKCTLFKKGTNSMPP